MDNIDTKMISCQKVISETARVYSPRPKPHRVLASPSLSSEEEEETHENKVSEAKESRLREGGRGVGGGGYQYECEAEEEEGITRSLDFPIGKGERLEIVNLMIGEELGEGQAISQPPSMHSQETVVQKTSASSTTTTTTESTTITSTSSGQVNEIQKQIHCLESPSESDNDSFVSPYVRPTHSKRSTMVSISSLASDNANYDLLLERLGAQDSPHETVTKQASREEDTDWEFWSKVISDFESVAKSEPKILSLHLQRGIPPSLRGMMWQLLAKSKSDRLEEEYLQLLREESVYEKAITRDLLRTFPYHPYFQGQEGQNALFNVVKAYSLYDADVGYCQGLSFIAGPLLLNMPEEEAFGVLVQLMTRFTLRGHFTPQMDLLHKRLYQLDGLLADTLPHIHRHFQAQGIQSGMYASQWYMTLFAYKFPLEVVFRIYDTILADGLDILHRVALALITKNQAILLSMEFDCLLNHLKEDMLAVYEDDVNELVREAYSISLSPKRLERLSKEYSVELIKANSEAEIISDLRRQNKALAETVRQLERITKQLENEHALVAKQLQVSNAQQLELQQTNSKLQQQVFDLSNALEILPKTIESRVREEMEILCTKNGALVQRNAALEDQLVYMETMVIDMKVKYAESENERETLQQRLADLKRWMVTESVF